MLSGLKIFTAVELTLCHNQTVLSLLQEQRQHPNTKYVCCIETPLYLKWFPEPSLHPQWNWRLKRKSQNTVNIKCARHHLGSRSQSIKEANISWLSLSRKQWNWLHHKPTVCVNCYSYKTLCTHCMPVMPLW